MVQTKLWGRGYKGVGGRERLVNELLEFYLSCVYPVLRLSTNAGVMIKDTDQITLVKV